LTVDEILRLVRVAVDCGVRKVRLTGGEPLLRKDLPEIVSAISRMGVSDLSCTTNGFLLEEKADLLKQARLDRVNVSLDTLDGHKFVEIARRGSSERVLRGIAAALAAGLSPVKINCVLMRGVNDSEAVDFAEWTKREPVHVRFIELMPMRWHLDEAAPAFDPSTAHGSGELLQLRQVGGSMLDSLQMRRLYVPASQVRRTIEARFGALEPAEVQTNGPARSYRIARAPGTLGFISQISRDLCANCNRLRLTHDGFLRPCLMSDGELDLRSALRSGATDQQLAQLFEDVVAHKPERHFLAEGQRVTGRGMSQIGG
jgi:cyclic pyranopterin phosphate synthase